MTQADSVYITPPLTAPESSITAPELALHLRLKNAGMRLERMDRNHYRIVWKQHQLVVSDLTLLEAALFIDRALVRR